MQNRKMTINYSDKKIYEKPVQNYTGFLFMILFLTFVQDKPYSSSF